MRGILRSGRLVAPAAALFACAIAGAKADGLYLGSVSGGRCDGHRSIAIGEGADGCVRIRGYIAAGAEDETSIATSAQETLFDPPRVKMRVGAAGARGGASPGLFFLNVGTSETAR